VLPNHVNLLSVLTIGALRFDAGGKSRYVFISGGFADVSDNTVTVLAEAAELAEDIDCPRAKAAMDRAQKRLTERTSNVDCPRAETSLKRAVARLSVATHR